MSSDEVIKIQIEAATGNLKSGLDQAAADVKDATGKMGEGAKSAGSKFGSIASSLKGLAIGATAAFAAKKVVDAIGHVAQMGEQLELVSRQTGMTVRQLSELKYAAGQSDISFASLQQGLTHLSLNLSQAATPTSRMSMTLRALGISATDSHGKTLTLNQLLPEIANKFQSTADGVNKTQIAMSLFGGRLGAQMIPLLDKGAAGIDQMEHKARALGVTIGQKDALADQKFEESMKTAKAEVQGMFTHVAEKLIPSLTKLMQSVMANKGVMAAINIVFNVVVSTVKLVIEVVEKVASSFMKASGISSASGHSMTETFKEIDHAISVFADIAGNVGRVVGSIFNMIGKTIGGVVAAVVEAVHGHFVQAFETLKSVAVKNGEIMIHTYNAVGKSVAAAFAPVQQAASHHAKAASSNKKQLESIVQVTEAMRAQAKAIKDTAHEAKLASHAEITSEKLKQKELEKTAMMQRKLEEQHMKTVEKNMKTQLTLTGKFLQQTLEGRKTMQQEEFQLEQRGFQWFTSLLQRKLMAVLENELLRMNASESAQSSTLAMQKAGQTEGLAHAGMTAIKGITTDSAKSFSGVFSALSGIPFIGPELAAVAAPAAEATVAAVAGKVVSASGGYDVPSDTFAHIHAREMVLPAPLADNIRSMTGHSGETHVHIHSADHEDAMRMLTNNRSAVMDAVQAASRDYQNPSPHALRMRP